MYEGKLIMYACIIRETFVFTVFRRVFHSILKLKLCRHACRRRDQIIPTCRYGKNMPTTALVSIPFFSSYWCYAPQSYVVEKFKLILPLNLTHGTCGSTSVFCFNLSVTYDYSCVNLIQAFNNVAQLDCTPYCVSHNYDYGPSINRLLKQSTYIVFVNDVTLRVNNL